MILALSTSSPWAVCAAFSPDGEFLRELCYPISRNASELLIQAVNELHPNFPNDLFGIAVDCGPGSFTGTKVGVTMAKVWAEITKAPLYVWNSFSLVSLDKGVYIPYKPNAFVVRVPGQFPVADPETWDPDWIGYGKEGDESVRLSWKDVPVLEGSIVEASLMKPEFFVEPSISRPKVAYRGGTT